MYLMIMFYQYLYMYITYKYDFWVMQILYRSNSYDIYDTRLEKMQHWTESLKQ